MSSTSFFIFFFNDTATTEIYTLSLHDALPIYGRRHPRDVHAPQLDADGPLLLRDRRQHQGLGPERGGDDAIPVHGVRPDRVPRVARGRHADGAPRDWRGEHRCRDAVALDRGVGDW